jgi:diguanylate cyclase (GGDEF)-like protein/PAS domain S-box-containing protein
VLIARDITILERAKAELREAQELFSQAFEYAPIGMALTTPAGHWVRINRSFCDLVGYTEEELLQTTFAAITHPDDRATDEEDVARLLAGEQAISQVEKRYIHADGHMVWINRSLSLIRDAAGEPLRFIVQVKDTSEQRRKEGQLRHQADHDPLTGLINRRRFTEALRDQIGRCRRYGEVAALLMIDLDGFKQVNDAFGHQAGDDVLRAVADLLRTRLRPTDTVARLGGDEFAVVLVHVGRPRSEAIVGELRGLIAGLRVPVGSRFVTTQASIGMAFMESAVADDEATLAKADLAMYAMKRASRGLAA